MSRQWEGAVTVFARITYVIPEPNLGTARAIVADTSGDREGLPIHLAKEWTMLCVGSPSVSGVEETISGNSPENVRIDLSPLDHWSPSWHSHGYTRRVRAGLRIPPQKSDLQIRRKIVDVKPLFRCFVIFNPFFSRLAWAQDFAQYGHGPRTVQRRNFKNEYWVHRTCHRFTRWRSDRIKRSMSSNLPSFVDSRSTAQSVYS